MAKGLLIADTVKPKPERKKKIFTPAPAQVDSGQRKRLSGATPKAIWAKIIERMAKPFISVVAEIEKAEFSCLFFVVTKRITSKRRERTKVWGLVIVTIQIEHGSNGFNEF